METMTDGAPDSPLRRTGDAVPPELDAETFRSLGHSLVDQLAEFFETIRERPVTPGEPPAYYRSLLDDSPLP